MLVEGLKRRGLEIGFPLQVVDHREHLSPAVHAVHRDAFRRRDVPHAEVFRVGVGEHREGIVLQAQHAGRAAAEAVIDVVAQLHKGRHRGFEAVVITDHRPISWIGDRGVKPPAGHDPLVGRAVAAVFGIPAAEEGIPPEFAGHVGDDVGELHAGDGGVDHAELALDARGGFGLRVEGVVMARAAAGPDQNAVRDGARRREPPAISARPEAAAKPIPNRPAPRPAGKLRRETPSQVRSNCGQKFNMRNAPKTPRERRAAG